jgi:hypothetical protein
MEFAFHEISCTNSQKYIRVDLERGMRARIELGMSLNLLLRWWSNHQASHSNHAWRDSLVRVWELIARKWSERALELYNHGLREMEMVMKMEWESSWANHGSRKWSADLACFFHFSLFSFSSFPPSSSLSSSSLFLLSRERERERVGNGRMVERVSRAAFFLLKTTSYFVLIDWSRLD